MSLIVIILLVALIVYVAGFTRLRITDNEPDIFEFIKNCCR
ncbi:MAG: hypothetical protein ACN4GR_10730 [Arenicellales bacterium]